VSYSNNGVSNNCGNEIIAANVSTFCSTTFGTGNISIVAQDPDVSSYSSLVATIYFTNVRWNFAITGATTSPAFNPGVATYTVTAPCTQLSASTTVNQNDCSTCSISINSAGTTATFNAASTPSFPVQLCYGPCSGGLYLQYNFAIATDFLALSTLTSSPGHATTAFDPAQLSYSVFTGYSSISVSTLSGSSDAVIVINGVQQSSIMLSNLTLLQPSTVSVQLRSQSLSCLSPNVYSVSVLQIPVQIDTLVSSASVPFSPSTHSYSAESNAKMVTLSGTAHEGMYCVVTADDGVRVPFASCTTYGAVLAVPNNVTIEAYPAFDDSPITTTYRISVAQRTTQDFAKVISISAALGGIIIISVVVVAVSCVIFAKRRKSRLQPTSFFGSDAIPMRSRNNRDDVDLLPF